MKMKLKQRLKMWWYHGVFLFKTGYRTYEGWSTRKSRITTLCGFDPRNDWLIGFSYSLIRCLSGDGYRFYIGLGPLFFGVTFWKRSTPR